MVARFHLSLWMMFSTRRKCRIVFCTVVSCSNQNCHAVYKLYLWLRASALIVSAGFPVLPSSIYCLDPYISPQSSLHYQQPHFLLPLITLLLIYIIFINQVLIAIQSTQTQTSISYYTHTSTHPHPPPNTKTIRKERGTKATVCGCWRCCHCYC